MEHTDNPDPVLKGRVLRAVTEGNSLMLEALVVGLSYCSEGPGGFP